MRKLLFYILITFFYACGAGAGDSFKKLSENYTYISESGANRISGSHSIYPLIVNYSNNKDYILVAQLPIPKIVKAYLSEDLFTEYNNIKYKKKFEEIDWSKEYKILNPELYVILDNKGISNHHEYEDIISCNRIADSLISTTKKYEYVRNEIKIFWIIIIKEDKLLGPYNKNEYLIKRKELNIPTSLKLDLEE